MYAYIYIYKIGEIYIYIPTILGINDIYKIIHAVGVQCPDFGQIVFIFNMLEARKTWQAWYIQHFMAYSEHQKLVPNFVAKF